MDSVRETRPYRVPRTFVRRSSVVLLLCDVATLAFTAVMAICMSRKNNSAPAIVTASSLMPLSFGLFGMYRRSFATSSRDEIYGAALPSAIAFGGFVAVAAIPGIHLNRTAGAAAVACGFVCCAANRALLHHRLRHLPPVVITPPLRRSSLCRSKRFVKRAMDLMLAVAAAPLAVGIGVVVALFIVLDDGGPVFFCQERAGRDGRPFRLYKFRSMRREAGDEWAIRGDDRVTRAGRLLRRTSLDELPQLINVFRGEMSLVGPRPEMLAYAAAFASKFPHYAERCRVKPGITGWAQVTLPRMLSSDDMNDVLAADLFYIDHCSIALDGTIIAKTAVEVLFHRAV